MAANYSLFYFITVFSLGVNSKYMLNTGVCIANDWIRNRVLWCRKQLLCRLCIDETLSKVVSSHKRLRSYD